MLAVMVGDGVAAADAVTKIADVTNFSGPQRTQSNILTTPDADKDKVKFELALGGMRYPQYRMSCQSEAWMRFLQTIGKLNSDVHTPGMSIRKFRYDCFIMSFDLDKIHPGTGLSHHGISTKDGSQLTLFVNDVPDNVKRCFVLAHHTVICRLGKLGCDVLT